MNITVLYVSATNHVEARIFEIIHQSFILNITFSQSTIMATPTPTLRPLACWKSILRRTRQQKIATRSLTTYHQNIPFSKYPLPPPGRPPTAHGTPKSPNIQLKHMMLIENSKQKDKSLRTTSLTRRPLQRTPQSPHNRPNLPPRPNRRAHRPLLQN